jgi:hypothetical protein
MSTVMRGFFGAFLIGLFVPRAVVLFADRLVLRAAFFLDFTTSARDYTAT